MSSSYISLLFNELYFGLGYFNYIKVDYFLSDDKESLWGVLFAHQARCRVSGSQLSVPEGEVQLELGNFCQES